MGLWFGLANRIALDIAVLPLPANGSRIPTQSWNDLVIIFNLDGHFLRKNLLGSPRHTFLLLCEFREKEGVSSRDVRGPSSSYTPYS